MKNYTLHMAIAIFSLFVVNNSFAKTNPNVKNEAQTDRWLGINVGLGIDNFNFNHLNDQLNTAQLPKLKNNLLIANFGFVFMPGTDERHFYDITAGIASFSNKGSNVSYQQSVRFGEFNFNYLLINKGRHKLYPSLGLGELTTSATYVDNVPEQNFANAVSNFSGERTFNLKTAFYGNVRIGYDFQVDKKGFIFIGAKAGYRFGLNNPHWSILFNNTSSSPTSNASGYYGLASLTVKI